MMSIWWFLAIFAVMVTIPLAVVVARKVQLLSWKRRPPIYSRQRWRINYPGRLSPDELQLLESTTGSPWVWHPPHDRPHDWKSAGPGQKIQCYAMINLDENPLGTALLLEVVQLAPDGDATTFLLSTSDSVPPYRAAIARNDIAYALRQLPRGQYLTIDETHPAA